MRCVGLLRLRRVSSGVGRHIRHSGLGLPRQSVCGCGIYAYGILHRLWPFTRALLLRHASDNEVI
jgi:hypothetical protein